MSKEFGEAQKRVSSDNERGASASHASSAPVGRQNLSDQIPPHESYEGRELWDPAVTWTPEEEKRVLRRTDLILLPWLCLMV